MKYRCSTQYWSADMPRTAVTDLAADATEETGSEIPDIPDELPEDHPESADVPAPISAVAGFLAAAEADVDAAGAGEIAPIAPAEDAVLDAMLDAFVQEQD